MGAARLSEVSVGPLFWGAGGALIYGGDIADFGGLTLMETPPPPPTHTPHVFFPPSGLALSDPLDSTPAGGHRDPPRLPREGDSAPPSPEHPKDLAPGGAHPEPLSLSHPTAPYRPQKSPTSPHSPPQISPHHLQGGGHQKPPTPPNSPPSTPPYPQGGGQQPHNSPLILPSPSSNLPQGGQQLPPRSPQPPPTPFPTSAQPPLGPPGLGGAGGLRGAPPTPGGLCAPEGVVVQLPAPPPMSPHPDTEQLPPESGQEPPPDPPAGTHG